MTLIARGWRQIFRLLVALIRRWVRFLEEIAERGGCKEKEQKRDYSDACCLDLPLDVLGRPDPYVYSQSWLRARGLAVTWDNPDFRLWDIATGALVPRGTALQPDHDYDIQVTVHDGSYMAALDTAVAFEMRTFGAGTGAVALGSDVIDVPGAGSAVAHCRWRTPAGGGHHCLIAIVSHADDANPLNNIGQHNTTVATPANDNYVTRFVVGNTGGTPRRYTLELDAYRLPQNVPRLEKGEDRRTLAVLRRIQDAH